jgi:uncharacterized protein (DUF1499 family)
MSYIEFDKIDGLYSGDHRRVAEVISDLFPTVRLIKVDSLHPAYSPEMPFALIDEPHLLPPYVIRYMKESEVDQRLVAWLVENNMHDSNSKVNRLKILEMAEAAMKAKGWTVVTQDPAKLRLEASVESFWFGFKDDVVLVVTADGAGSAVDMRSVSRVGISDLGANAKRIEALLAALKR